MPDPNDPLGYYATLGVATDASADQIRQAYRNLAMQLHPDRNPGRDTTAAFQMLQAAYAALKDDTGRADYAAYASACAAGDACEADGPGAPGDMSDEEALGFAIMLLVAIMSIVGFVWSWSDALCYVLGPLLVLSLLNEKTREAAIAGFKHGYEQTSQGGRFTSGK